MDRENNLCEIGGKKMTYDICLISKEDLYEYQDDVIYLGKGRLIKIDGQKVNTDTNFHFWIFADGN